MAYAAGVAPDDLDKAGWDDVANRLRILLTLDALPDINTDNAEEHLARTPGTTVREREELILRLRELRGLRHSIRAVLARARADPFEEQFLSNDER